MIKYICEFCNKPFLEFNPKWYYEHKVKGAICDKCAHEGRIGTWGE